MLIEAQDRALSARRWVCVCLSENVAARGPRPFLLLLHQAWASAVIPVPHPQASNGTPGKSRQRSTPIRTCVQFFFDVYSSKPGYGRVLSPRRIACITPTLRAQNPTILEEHRKMNSLTAVVVGSSPPSHPSGLPSPNINPNSNHSYHRSGVATAATDVQEARQFMAGSSAI